jgi:hypothetical protein
MIVLVVRVGGLCVCREVKGTDGKMQYLEPCSPSEPGSIETTLTELAEKGLAPQVGSAHPPCALYTICPIANCATVLY